MFPLRDHNPSRRTPYVNFALIAINVIVFLSYTFTLTDNVQLSSFYNSWGMRPAEVSSGVDYHTMLTCMFLHGGWMHIGGNMMFLWIFGDNMEDTLGHIGYLLFYLGTGIGAGVVHILSGPDSIIPTIGASGAVAGVMGGYLLFYPKAKVDILLFLGFIVHVFKAPAWVLLGVWFGLEAYKSVASQANDGVAHWAHTGGLALGVLSMLPIWYMNGATSLWRKTRYIPPHPPGRELFIFDKPIPGSLEKED